MIVSSGATGAAAETGTAWPKQYELRQIANKTEPIRGERGRGVGDVMGECRGCGNGGSDREDVAIQYNEVKQRRFAVSSKRSVMVSFRDHELRIC